MNLVTLLRIEETYRLIGDELTKQHNFYKLDQAKLNGNLRKTLRERKLAECFSSSRLDVNMIIFTFRVDGFHCNAKWDIVKRNFLHKEVRFSASLKKNPVLQ